MSLWQLLSFTLLDRIMTLHRVYSELEIQSSAGEYPKGDTVIIEANYEGLGMSYNNRFYFSLVAEKSLGNVWGRLFNKEWSVSPQLCISASSLMCF